MITHSDYIDTYRLPGYAPRVHLSIYDPRVVASGILTQTPSNPTVLLNVSFLVGAQGDVEAGFLIRIRDTGTQKIKGYTRVRFYGTATSSSIPVRELGFASVACLSGDTFEALRFVPMDTKLTTADATFSPDGQLYVTQGGQPPPLVCSGGNSVRWVDAGETFGTIHPDGSNTSLVDPASSTPPTHFYVNDSTGTAFASGSVSTDESPVIEADVGSWMLRHQGQDPDNGQTAIQWTHHIVHDAAHPPYECILNDYSGDHERGISWTAEVVSTTLTKDSIVPLALCFLWVDDVFMVGGTKDMHRSEGTGRSQIIGIGYARRVNTVKSADDGVEHITIEIQSPLMRLQEIASYSKVMVENATPDDWNDVKTLGFKRGITQIEQFYTTATEAGIDFIYHPSFSDARYPTHLLQRSDPIGQFRELADARNGRVTQREWGARLEVQAHPGLRPPDDRTETDWTLTDDDAYDFAWSEEMADNTELFQLEGIIAGTTGNVSVYSRIGPMGGKSADTVPRKSPDSQTQANEWAGLVYGLKENVYQDDEGGRYHVGELTLTVPGQYLVLDFIPDYVRFNVEGQWVDFSLFRFWLKGFSWSVDADSGEPVTRFVWQCETGTRAGVTHTPTTQSVPPYTPPGDIPVPYTPPLPPIIPVTGALPQQVLAFAAGEAKCTLFADILLGVGAGTMLDKSTGLIDPIRLYGSNPYAYDAGLGIEADGDVFYAAALGVGFTSWGLRSAAVCGPGSTDIYAFKGSYLRNGWWMACSNNGFRAVTFDLWNTKTVVAGTYNSFAICPHNANRLIGIRREGSNPNAYVRLYKSTDGGLTESLLCEIAANSNFAYWMTVSIPYMRPSAYGGGLNRDDGDMVVFVTLCYQFGGSTGADVIISSDGGVTFPGDPAAALRTAGFWTYKDDFGISFHTHDADRLIVPGMGGFGGSLTIVSNDGGVTAPISYEHINFATSLADLPSLGENGWPALGTEDPDVGYWVVWNGTPGHGGIEVSGDNGQSFTELEDPSWADKAASYAEFRLATAQ